MSKFVAAAYFSVPPVALALNLALVTRHELSIEREARYAPRLAPPLPSTAMCVEWRGAESSGSAPSGGRFRVVTSFMHCGNRVWPDRLWAGPPEVWGVHAVRIGARWRKAGQTDWEPSLDWRADLPHAVLPRSTVRLPLYVPAPRTPGRYVVELDLMQERVAWFSQHGATTQVLEVEVR